MTVPRLRDTLLSPELDVVKRSKGPVLVLRLAPLAAACAITLLAGCGSMDKFHEVDSSRSLQATDTPDGRLLVRSASMTIEVSNVSVTSERAIGVITQSGGFVQQSSADEEKKVSVVARVPEAQLDAVLDRLAELGDVTRRSLTAADVTDEVVDQEARLKNLVATRDTYRQLLDKAANVQDAVSVERELSRVQGEIDAMQAHVDSLRSRVALSEVRLNIEKEVVLGPLGYLGEGLWWLFSKLFVISP